jgi:hypothetical protein
VNLARQFPCRLAVNDEARCSPQSAIVAGVCPLNPFGGGGKASGLDASSASSTATSDEKTTASEGSLAVGPGGQFIEGPSFQGAGTVTITGTDSGAVAGALQTVGDVNTALTNFVNEANTAAVTRQGSLDDLLKEVLTKLAAEDTAEKTGFQSLLISPLFWLGMAGLAVVGVFVWRKR